MSVSITLMNNGNSDASAVCQCLVSGELDFNTASEAREAVAALIREHEALDVSLSGVSSSNSAGLALLLDWRALARSSSHSVTFSHIPDSLDQLAEVCQVKGLI